MRILSLLIALSLCAAAGTEPGDAALRFLESVRNRSVDLTPGKGTAISPHTSANKVKQIAGRLERMVMDLDHRPLRVGRINTDGDLAGVLVWLDTGNDPSLIQVFPVAMIQRDGQWLPAPVPASFENCNAGYDRESRRRAAALEDWMLRQQVIDLADLRNRALVDIRRKIESSIDRPTLRRLTPLDAINRFLDACRHEREYELLGLMGGLQEQLPDHWAMIATSLEAAIHQPAEVSPWHLLTKGPLLSLRLAEDADDDVAMVTIACLDPERAPLGLHGMPMIQFIHLEALRNDRGELRVQPPAFLWNPAATTQGTADPDLDKDLLDAFSRQLRQTIPATPADSAEAALQHVTRVFRNGHFPQLAPLLKLPDDPAECRQAVLQAADLWEEFHGLEIPQRARVYQWLVPLDLKVADHLAAASFQTFSLRKPDRFELTTLYFIRTDEGWLWSTKPGEAVTDTFKDWRREQRDQWRDQWRDHLLAPCPFVGNLPAAGPPGEAACRQLVTDWLNALQAGDIDAALQHCARLSVRDSAALLLRNLSYDMTASIQSPRRQILAYYNDDGWAAIGLDSNSSSKPTFPFYPIIQTKEGPRILLEADLIASTSRGRTFLNDTTFGRLSQIDAEATRPLAALFARHKKACLPDP